MIIRRCGPVATILMLSLLAAGCGTPREKTAPCKRPANLSSYAGHGDPCGPMFELNTDRRAALAAIEDMTEDTGE